MMSTILQVAALAAVLAVGTAGLGRAADAVSRTDVRVVTADGVGLHVRIVEPARSRPGLPLVLVHGARVPGVGSFDLDVPGGSLAADLAVRLERPVFVMDARGYGGSDRPAAMERPPGEARPVSRAYEVVRDIHAVAAVAMERTGAPRVVLLGWATGGMWSAYYASLWPERVGALVALNALYGGSARHPTLGPGSPTADPERPDRLNPSIGAYRWNDAASLLPSWDTTIPLADKSSWRDDAVAAAYVRAALASDPRSGERSPPAFRAPLGAIEDSFYQAGGRRLFDAGAIVAPILIVRSARDFWSRPEDVVAFALDAVRARSVRTVTLPEATHYVHLDRPERGRDALLDEVVAFLRTASASDGPP